MRSGVCNVYINTRVLTLQYKVNILLSCFKKSKGESLLKYSRHVRSIYYYLV
jgi:hypothetical protein